MDESDKLANLRPETVMLPPLINLHNTDMETKQDQIAMCDEQVDIPLEFGEEIDEMRMEADKSAAVKAITGIDHSMIEQRLVSNFVLKMREILARSFS